MPPVKMTWYEGLMPPRPDELEPGRDLTGDGNGILFVGDKGKMMEHRIIPEAKRREHEDVPKTLPRSIGHYKEWIEACKARKPAGSDFGYGGPLTEVALLGVIAMRFKGRKLEWDSAGMKFTNLSEANAFLKPSFREGWSL